MPSLLINPTSLYASSLLTRTPMSKAQQSRALSEALQKQMESDPRYGQVQDWRDRSMTPFGVGAGWTGVAAQMASALVAKNKEKGLERDYQDRQASKNETYARLLAPGGPGEPSINDLPPAQRAMMARIIETGQPDLIEAAAGQYLKSAFEPAARPKYGMTTADGKRLAYREDDPSQTIVIGTADDKPPSEWDMYERAMQQMPENERVPFLQYKKMLAEAGSTRVNTNVSNIMPGPKKADEAFAGGPYVDWMSGGYANTQKNIQGLDEAIGQLEASKPGDLTGPVVGMIPEGARAIVAPQSLDVQQRIAQIVQGGMREVLGGQYTQKEADQYIARMYDPRLGKEANINRLRAFRNSVMRGAQAKQAAAMYFQKNGTLEGFQGSMPTWDDFYAAIGEKREEKGGKPDNEGWNIREIK